MHTISEDRSAPSRRVLVLTATLLCVAALNAQDQKPPAAIYMSAAQIEATLARMGAIAKTGAAATVADGIVVRRRNASDEPQYAIIHPLSIEIYQITEGTATLVTGGTLRLPLSDSAPDLVRSTAIENGETRKVAKGDVVVLPPGTAHWFSAIDGSITYLEARIRIK
jgi:mannose-6-phosphate isomerase-like protein (cupin superfamily)